MNKRGITTVVTVALIILTVTLAATILWAAVKPFAQETSETLDTGTCLGTTFRLISCSFDYATGKTIVSVSRTHGNEPLSGLEFIFYNPNKIVKIIKNNSLPKELETTTFSFYNQDILTASRVDVSAIIGEKICQPSGEPVYCGDIALRSSGGNCEDGVDNDGDGWSDAYDADCYSSGVFNPGNTEQFTALGTCSDGIDNNGDGVSDAQDPSCTYPPSGSGGGGGGGGSGGNEHTIVITNPGSAPTQCSDGVDNDDDGLGDYSVDPGCANFEDNNEGDESRSHNFRFMFGTDGYISEINWTNSSGGINRLIWDEREPIGANPTVSRYGPAGVRYHTHSAVNDNGALAWSYNIGPDYFKGSYENISHLKISENLDEVVVLENDSVLFVTDKFRFYENTIYEIINVTNSWAILVENITLPVYLGGLVIGNYSASYNLNLTTSDISRLVPLAGGTIETNFTSNSAIEYSYPSLNSFSPISAMWDSKISVGQQYLTSIYQPDSVKIVHKAYNQFTPLIRSYIYIDKLAPMESRTFIVAYQVSNGGDWKATLEPYKNWFIANNGGNEPRYCPSGPLAYHVGSNSQLDYDTITNRYLVGTTLKNLFNTEATREVMKNLGFEQFGLWQTALNSACLIGDKNCSRDFIQECFDKGNIGATANCEFSGNIDLIDPNIDAGRNKTKIKEFTDTYALSNVNVFWYARPCGEIYGANISFDANGSEIFTAGIPTGYADLDLRNVTNRDRQFQRLAELAAQGVKGFYYDAAGCPGDEAFFEYAKKNLTAIYGNNLFFSTEGARDRVALRLPQIPLIKQPVYSYNSSVLIDFLVPHATYYGGIVNTALNYTNGEFDDILNKGYQVIPLPGPPTLASLSEIIEGEKIGLRACRYINQSYYNRYARWQAYGYNITGCVSPQAPPACPI